MVVGCGARRSCHRVGQILGRSIRLGVIHHLRTTHGSRGSGGPGAAAASLRARAMGAAAAAAAAASFAAPAATAAKAGPRRPRASLPARAREGLAISGGPCAGTFIFSPSGCPLARAYIAAWGRGGPPRGGGMTVPGSGQGSASCSCSPGPGRAALGSGALVCIHTMHAPASSYHQCSRLGEDREAVAEGGVDWGGGERFASPGFDAERSKVPPTRPAAGRSPSRGTPGRADCGLERSLKRSPPPSLGMVVGGEWYARGSAPLELRGFPPSLRHLAAWARASPPQGACTGNTNADARAKGKPSVPRSKTEQAKNKLEYSLHEL